MDGVIVHPEAPIPGQTPLLDYSGLRAKGVRTAAELNEAEAENVRKATVKYLLAAPTKRAAPFDLAWLRRLHAEMLGDVWAWAGAFRRHETNIGSPPHRIEIDLQSMLEDLKIWHASGMPMLEQAARLHHVSVKVHPFTNGNGRWSRMLANIWLRRHGSAPIAWPETTIGTASSIRGGYIQAVKAADSGDYSKLLALHERFIEAQTG
ncbi:MAG: mobile mystery protein B [Phycisphaeraceae bacterium]|nr:mobile mystery protein B [Phycisphaeraceae bacterium]